MEVSSNFSALEDIFNKLFSFLVKCCFLVSLDYV